MIWRRIGNSFGTSPPPVRDKWPDENGVCLKVRTRIRTITTFNAGPVIDSGWSDWIDDYAWPASGAAAGGGAGYSTEVKIQTAGRVMPWQIVVRDRIITGGTTTFNDYTTDMVPGTVTTFSYSAGTGTTIEAINHYYNVPAEGV